MSLRTVKSLPSLRRALHSTSTAPKPSHLLTTQQSAARSHFNSLTVHALKYECKTRGLRLSGRKVDLIDRIVGFEAAKSFTTSSPGLESVAVPTPPKAKPGADEHPVTKIPVKFDAPGKATYTSSYSEPTASSSNTEPVGGDIHVIDGSTNRVSSMNVDLGDGSAKGTNEDDCNSSGHPLPQKDKRFLRRFCVYVGLWWLVQDIKMEAPIQTIE